MVRIKKEVPPPTRRSKRLQRLKKSKEELEAKITKKKLRSYQPKPRESSRLLALPGELLNTIYRYALVESEQVSVFANRPGEPALLKVCTTIRKEASGIYYGENQFSLHIVDYNGAVCAPFARQLRIANASSPLPKPRLQMRFSGHPNWDNLVAWMKAYSKESVPVPLLEPPETRNETVVAAAIQIIDATRKLSWTAQEAALKAMYTSLTATCSPWVKPADRMRH